MGIFDIFKKEKDNSKSYDPTNIKLTDLRKGFVLDYDLKSWVVEAVYEYDWGNNYFSREYKIDSGDEVKFLSIDNDDGLFITLTQKIKIRSVQEDLPEYILKNEQPPKKLEYKGIKFFYDGEEIGSFKDIDDASGEEAKFISWEYFDDDDKFVLCLEQWGEEDFEASFGDVVKEFEFSNILPGSN